MKLDYLWFVFIVLTIVGSLVEVESSNKEIEGCFCQSRDTLTDCSCNMSFIDQYNNAKIYPRLQSLLTADYFRFYKINLKKPCPFWRDNNRCVVRHCHVEPCTEDKIPSVLKASKELDCDTHEDINEELSCLNKTISAQTKDEFALWKKHDDALDNFCIIDNEDDSDSEYVDLLLNPEQYTGYKGSSAHRIWRSIYMENCFRPRKSFNDFEVLSKHVNSMCIEKRAFYTIISGLHTSINIHLCANYLSKNYLLPKTKNGLHFMSPEAQWDSNLTEFRRRFDAKLTNGEGPQWLRNLYFVYLLELRALAKAASYFQQEQFYTGSELDDENVREAVKDFLLVAQSFPVHFNESTMFVGGAQAKKLKEEFRLHFQNISRIMDCIECEKCKLWGKLQIQGLGTALKILFSGKFDDEQGLCSTPKCDFQLLRSEIVALFNSFGRLSTSIYKLGEFRRMMNEQT